MNKIKINEIKIKKRILVNETELEIYNNGIMSIKGKNGTGKTLLANVIFNALMNLGDNVKLIEQGNNQIMRNLSVKDNLCIENDDVSVLYELCNEEEIKYFNELLKRDSKKLSGGEKRIISIMRMIISKPQILIIDEPTNDLDYKNVDFLVKVLKKLKQNTFIIVITHDDRIDNIVDITYKIQDSRLIKLEQNNFIEDSKLSFDKKRKNNYKNNKIITKGLKFNYASIIPIVLIVFFLLKFSYGNKNRQIIEIPLLSNNNRIDIYLHNISNTIYTFSGTAPLGLMVEFGEVIKSNGDIFKDSEKLLDYKFSSDYNLKDIIPFNIKESDKFKMYPIEYYSFESRKIDNVFYRYLLDFENKSGDEYYVDTEGLGIKNEYVYNKKRIEFNKDIYEAVVEKLEKEDDFIAHIVVIMKDGYSMWDFLSEPFISEFNQDGVRIRSNDTINIFNEALKFKSISEDVNYIISVVVIAVFMYIILFVLYLLYEERSIVVAKNYGIKKKYIKKRLINKRMSYIVYATSVLISCLVVLILSWIYNKFYYVDFIFIAMLLAYFAVIEVIAKVSIYFYVNYVYRWKYR